MRVVQIGLVAGMLFSVPWVPAQVFQHDFESDTLITSGPVTGNFPSFSGAQTGNSGFSVEAHDFFHQVTLSAGIDQNGVGGTKSLFLNVNGTGSNEYFLQIGHLNIPAANVGPEFVRVSVDIAVQGALDSTPWRIMLTQSGVVGYTSLFTPTLATNGTYTKASFILSQGTQLNPHLYNPALGFWFLADSDNAQYGSDAGNIARFDNLVVEIVPEPGCTAVLTFVAGVLVSGRRRKNRQN